MYAASSRAARRRTRRTSARCSSARRTAAVRLSASPASTSSSRTAISSSLNLTASCVAMRLPYQGSSRVAMHRSQPFYGRSPHELVAASPNRFSSSLAAGCEQVEQCLVARNAEICGDRVAPSRVQVGKEPFREFRSMRADLASADLARVASWRAPTLLAAGRASMSGRESTDAVDAHPRRRMTRLPRHP